MAAVSPAWGERRLGTDTRCHRGGGHTDTDLRCHRQGSGHPAACHRRGGIDTVPRCQGSGDENTHRHTGCHRGTDTAPRCHRGVGLARCLQRPRAAQSRRCGPRGAAVTAGPRARGRPGPCAVRVRPSTHRRRSAPPALFPNAACATGAERASRGGGVAAPPARGERFWKPRCALRVAGAP